MKLLASSTTSENRNLWHILWLYIYWIYWYLRHHCIMCFKLINFRWSCATSAYISFEAVAQRDQTPGVWAPLGVRGAVQRCSGCPEALAAGGAGGGDTTLPISPGGSWALSGGKLRKTRHTIKTLKTLYINIVIKFWGFDPFLGSLI
jgi:hypothetical protein